MIVLGIVCIAAALLVPKLAVLFTVGVILLVVGLALVLAGYLGHPVGGRGHWF